MHVPHEELEAFVLGQLADEAFSRVEAHLADCESCGRRLDEIDLSRDRLIAFLRGNEVANLTTLAPPPSQDSASSPTDSPATSSHEASMVQKHLGPFEILNELGSGGMGVVYRAYDPRLQRDVALKIIHARHVAGAEARRRFRQEAEAAAHLQHANIVQIFESGEHEGIAYCVFEYVEGGDLAQKIEGSTLAVDAAADLTIVLADAVHYAHLRQVVHRDLKPANILLTANDTPKIADFGLAKRLDGAPSGTLDGMLVGTPPYMAPEQAAGDIPSIGPATDVYALGAVLYELVTRQPPFQGLSHSDILKQVREKEVVAPRCLVPGLDRDLDTICLKCLRKRPADRYASAADLAADLRRFRAGLPISARRLGWGEQVVKFVKRHPVEGLVAGILALTLIAFVATVIVYNIRLGASLAENQRSLEFERRNAYSLQLQLAATATQADPTGALQLLDDPQRCPPDLRDFSWGYLRRLSDRQRGEWQNGTDVQVLAALGKDGLFVTGDRQGILRLWSVAEQMPRWERPAHTGTITDVRLSPDCDWLVASSEDGSVSFWTLGGQRAGPPLEPDSGPVNSIAFCPDGERLAVVHTDGAVRVWSFPGREILAELDSHRASVFRVAFSADGQYLATCSRDETLRIWKTADWSEIAAPREHRGFVTDVRFHPRDPRQLATSCNDRTVRQWSVTPEGDVRLTRILRGFEGTVSALSFSANGQMLAAGSYDGLVRVWDADTGQMIASHRSLQSSVSSVAFDDTDHVLVGTRTGQLKRWTMNVETPLRFRAHDQPLLGLTFLDPGETLVSCGYDGNLFVWSAEGDTWHPRWRHSHTWISAFETVPDRGLFFWEGGGEILSGQLASRGDVVQRKVLDATLTPTGLAFSRDSERLVIADVSGIQAVHWATGAPYWSWTEHAVSFMTASPTADLIAAADEKNRIWLGDAKNGQFSSCSTPAIEVTGLCFSPDGNRLAVGGANGKIAMHQSTTGRLEFAIAGHSAEVLCLAFSPDGQTLASGGLDGEIRLWDAVAGCERGRLLLGDAVQTLAFSSDGRALAGSGVDGHVQIWRAR